MRFGIGFDVHAFAAGRKLILGGVEIPHARGLQGHSDADVLLHAVIDALLGALALGDIGQHFPDTDPEYRDISSSILLKKSYQLVQHEHYEINNLDCVVILQQPRIASYLPAIRRSISEILWCDLEQVSVKATTTERLGFVGREEGVAAMAVVSLRKRRGR